MPKWILQRENKKIVRIVFQCHSIERHKLLTESRISCKYKVARDHPRTSQLLYNNNSKSIERNEIRFTCDFIKIDLWSSQAPYSRPSNYIKLPSGNGHNNISWSSEHFVMFSDWFVSEMILIMVLLKFHFIQILSELKCTQRIWPGACWYFKKTIIFQNNYWRQSIFTQ